MYYMFKEFTLAVRVILDYEVSIACGPKSWRPLFNKNVVLRKEEKKTPANTVRYIRSINWNVQETAVKYECRLILSNFVVHIL